MHKSHGVLPIEFIAMKKKLIRIHGGSHSGSTSLGALIASGPTNREFHLGEVYVMMTEKRRLRFLGRQKNTSERVNCQARYLPECINGCSVFANLDWSICEGEDAYLNLAHYLGAETLIDSSKNLAHFDRFPDAKGFEIMDLVVFRDTNSAILSFSERELTQNKFERNSADWIEALLDKHLQYYRTVIERNLPAMDFNTILKNPKSATHRLCAYFELEYFHAKEELWNYTSHHIAGARSTANMIKLKQEFRPFNEKNEDQITEQLTATFDKLGIPEKYISEWARIRDDLRNLAVI